MTTSPAAVRRALSVAIAALGALGACGGGADAVRTPVASVVVTPPTVVVQAGADLPLSVQARDASDRALVGRVVFWSVSDTSVATVSPSGVVRGRSPGTARVAASVEGRSAVATVTVLPRPVASVEVVPSSVQVQVAATRQLEARTLDAAGGALAGRAVAWTTSDPAIARVNELGLVTGVAPGAATITAASEGRTGSAAVLVVSVPVASVTVAPARDTLFVGESVQLAGIARDAADAALIGRAVTWTSSSNAVATVSSSGLVAAVAPGSATITAASEGRTGTAAIVVLPRPVSSVAVSPPDASIEVGAAIQLTTRLTDAEGNLLSGRLVTYSSGAPGIASVDGGGRVVGVAAGTAVITATSEGRTGSATVRVTPQPVASVQVTPAAATLSPGGTVQLDVVVRSASGAVLTGRAVTWIGAPGVATVSASGLVTAIATGTAVIFAQVEGVLGSATITVR